MASDDDKVVISDFLQKVFDRRNLDKLDEIVDEVFAPDHALRSPETGTEEVKRTEVIKRALRDYHEHLEQGTRVRCTILKQIAEGDWVATSYALREAREEHMGVIFSRLVDSKIQETFVVAREVSSAPEGQWEDRKIFN